MFSKVVNEQGSNRSTTATTLLTKMTEEANEFCKMLNEQVASACPSRGAQINQALQITQHALSDEFQGKSTRLTARIFKFRIIESTHLLSPSIMSVFLFLFLFFTCFLLLVLLSHSLSLPPSLHPSLHLFLPPLRFSLCLIYFMILSVY